MKIRLFALVVSLAAASAAAGQQQADPLVTDPVVGGQRGPSAGWSLTPALVMSRTYDDNVLLRGPGDPHEHDAINVISPRGDATYHGRQTDLSFRYDGSIILYNRLDTLNSYEQHGDLLLKHHMSARSSFFTTFSMTAAPTTEVLQLTGIPYIRAGVFTETVHSGFEHQASKRLTVTASGYFDQARFNATGNYENILLGGYGIGGGVSLKERLSERTSLTGDADVQHETIGSAHQQFDIQHVLGGVEHQLSERMRVFAAGGFSRLSETTFAPARTGPSFRIGLSEHYRSTIIDLSYDRSFVPSFGIGGTTQNGSVTARVQMPITRRLYTQNLVSWQQQDPIAIEVPVLRSTWVQSSVGYTASQWFRIEAYFAGTRQTAGREDGSLLTHNQFGIQVIASKPVRIR